MDFQCKEVTKLLIVGREWSSVSSSNIYWTVAFKMLGFCPLLSKELPKKNNSEKEEWFLSQIGYLILWNLLKRINFSFKQLRQWKGESVILSTLLYFTYSCNLDQKVLWNHD